MVDNNKVKYSIWFKVNFRIGLIMLFLILATIGILGFTVMNAQDQQLDNIIVDLAGEQDTRSQQYLKEVLLRSHGAQVDHHITHQGLNTSWEVLTNGGAMVIDPQANVNIFVPPAPNELIRDQLHQQKQLIDEFTLKSDQFLQLPLSDTRFSSALDELLTLNEKIHGLSDNIENSFIQHSEAKLFSQSGLIATMGASVGIMGLFLSAQLRRTNRELEKEIGERRHVEEALRQSEERFELAVRGTSDGLWDSNRPITFEPWNYPQAPVWYSRRFKELLGYNDDEFKNVRESWVSRIHPEDQPHVFLAIRDHLERRVSYDVDFRMRTREGNYRWFNGRGQAVWDDEGEPLRMAGFLRDITERRRSEEALRESEIKRIEAFRQSDALKSALLSSVSHELRTPLTTIKASVSSLLGQGADGTAEVREEFLQGINLDIDYLTRLVENLLDMSRIEAGTLIPHCEWHPFEELVEGAIRRTTDFMKSHPLELKIDPNLPPVYVDGVEIQQVLVNLLDNAAKYSAEPSLIRVEAMRTSQNIEVRVADKGEGIRPEDWEKVFDRFYRVRLHRNHSVRGTGLGLSICKGIVEAHGGQIWVETTQGGGATMAFSVPLQEPPPALSLDDRYQHLVTS